MVPISEPGRLKFRGSYIRRIEETYRTIFGGRHFATSPKRRRDLGTKRDLENMETRRKKQHKPMLLATFKRKRAAAIDRAIAEPDEDRRAKRARFGAPRDQGLFVTAKIKKVRADAEVREQNKTARIKQLRGRLATVAKPRARPRRQWLGEGAHSRGETDGQTSVDVAADGKTPAANETICVLFPHRLQGER